MKQEHRPLFRALTIDEVELRAAQVVQGSNSYYTDLLIYKDARVDMRLLDETFTPMGWERTHELINGNLFCTISVYDENAQRWVSKQDVGTKSNQDAEKGEASDSFKRAGFCWGIGRELYTAPQIRIFLDASEVKEYTDARGNKKYRFKYGVSFKVTRMDVEKGVITALEVTDAKGVVRFSYSNGKAKKQSKPAPAPAPVPNQAQEPAPSFDPAKIGEQIAQVKLKMIEANTIEELIDVCKNNAMVLQCMPSADEFKRTQMHRLGYMVRDGKLIKKQ